MTHTYTLSSTDPKHYNRIRVSMPTSLTSKYVQICVRTLTMNCNIEVLSDDDFIQFLIAGELKTLKLKKTTNLQAATLGHLLNTLFKEQDIPIECEITEANTVCFICEKTFQLWKMTYNAQQVCGFYYLKDAEFPVVGTAFTTKGKVEVETKENVDVTEVEWKEEITVRVSYKVRLDLKVQPDNAYGYRVYYELEEGSEQYCELEQLGEDAIITGKAAGTGEVKITIKNSQTLETSTPDFEHKCAINVVDIENNTKIDEMTLDADILNMNVGDSELLIATPTPNTVGGYHERWYSDNPKVAVVDYEGNVQAIGDGGTELHYVYKYSYEENNKTEEVEGEVIAHVVVNAEERDVQKYRIEAGAIGNLLSTPVFYLLANAGSPWFGNYTDGSQLMMSATVAMVINNSYTGQFPMVAEGDIVSTVFLNTVSDLMLRLVDANMHEPKLLNPMYCTLVVQPQLDQLNGVIY